MHKISVALICLVYSSHSQRMETHNEELQRRLLAQRQSRAADTAIPSRALAMFFLTHRPSVAFNPSGPARHTFVSSPTGARLALRTGSQVPAASITTPGCIHPDLCSAVQRGTSLMAGDAFKDTRMRSAVKAVGWRITAGIVTAMTSYYFTGSLAMAASIVGWDLCSKSVTMFIGERIWNKFDWGKEKGADSNKRSLAKAIAWRIFAAFNTLIGAALLTKGQTGIAGKIAGSDSIVKTVLYYLYERAWSKFSWGREFEEQNVTAAA